MKGMLPLAAFVACLVGLSFLAVNIYKPDDAKELVGQQSTIEGVVASVIVSKRGDTFINFGDTHPRNLFVAIVFDSDRGNFSFDLKEMSGKRVRVTGYVRDYNGKPQMTIQTAEQLKVLD